jgi:hypothetical protein
MKYTGRSAELHDSRKNWEFVTANGRQWTRINEMRRGRFTPIRVHSRPFAVPFKFPPFPLS